MPSANRETVSSRMDGGFPETHWSVVLEAQGANAEALASFCRAYWYPLYSFARRSGLARADAEDATQAFFERLLAGDLLAHARAERGRLRAFLLRSYRNFTVEEWRKRGAQKRGGGVSLVAMDACSAEERFALEPRDGVTPEMEYERVWARELLRRALTRLASDYDALKDQLVKGSVLDNDYFPPLLRLRYSRWFRYPRLPICNRSAIQRTVIVVSARNRTARAIFSGAPFGRAETSPLVHRSRRNSSAMIRSALASSDSARSSP